MFNENKCSIYRQHLPEIVRTIPTKGAYSDQAAPRTICHAAGRSRAIFFLVGGLFDCFFVEGLLAWIFLKGLLIFLQRLRLVLFRRHSTNERTHRALIELRQIDIVSINQKLVIVFAIQTTAIIFVTSLPRQIQNKTQRKQKDMDYGPHLLREDLNER